MARDMVMVHATGLMEDVMRVNGMKESFTVLESTPGLEVISTKVNGRKII